MRTYLIGYDLNKTGKDYSGLRNAIKEISGTWWNHLESTFIIKTNNSAKSIRDTLKQHIDSDDELLVIRVMQEAAWIGFNQKGSDWLKENLTSE